MLVHAVDIEVRKNERWYFEGREIIQDTILDYFKSNLIWEDNKYYILNNYGDKSEKGEISLQGFPLKVGRIFWSKPKQAQVIEDGHCERNPLTKKDDNYPLLYLHLDCGLMVSQSLLNLEIEPPDLIWLYVRNIPCRLSSSAMVQLRDLLTFEANENGEEVWYWELSDENGETTERIPIAVARPEFGLTGA